MKYKFEPEARLFWSHRGCNKNTGPVCSGSHGIRSFHHQYDTVFCVFILVELLTQQTHSCTSKKLALRKALNLNPKI